MYSSYKIHSYLEKNSSYRLVCTTVRKKPLALVRWKMSHRKKILSKLVSDGPVVLMFTSNGPTCFATMCHDLSYAMIGHHFPGDKHCLLMRNIWNSLLGNAVPHLFCGLKYE